MLNLIKLAFFALSVLAIVTADDNQKDAMWQGAQAYGAALVASCTRQDGPCLSLAKAVTAKFVEVWKYAPGDRPEDAANSAAPKHSRQEQAQAKHRMW